MKQIPIIAVSQQNRDSTQETGVGTKNIAQSDRIGQDSTIVIILEKKDETLTVSLVKSRDTGSGKVLKYQVDYDKGVYSNIPIEDESKPTTEEDEKEYEDIRMSYEPTYNGEAPF